MTSLFLLALHVFANVVWIGAIVAVGMLTARAASPDGAGFAKAAYYIYRAVASPAFGVSFGLALVLIALAQTQGTSYFKHGFFHVKLTAAFVVIGLHHVIGAKARRADAGEPVNAGAVRGLTIALLVFAAVSVFAIRVRTF